MRILSKAVLVPVAAGVAIGVFFADKVRGAVSSVTSGVAGVVAGKGRKPEPAPSDDDDDDGEE